MNQPKEKKHSDIIILGLGLSGMITALAFAKNKINTTIIEAKSASDNGFFEDIRTTALTSSSKNFFNKIGIWQEIEKLSGLINEIYVVDNKAPNMLHFITSDTPNHQIMGYLVENTKLKKLLFKLVIESKFIDFIDTVTYKKIINQKNTCQLDLTNDKQLSCKLLIACDGKNSKAKSLFFSDEITKNYNQKAITFIVEHQKKHEGVAVEHFFPSGPFAILPLKNENRSSIVWTVSKEYASTLVSLDPKEFIHLAQENFGQFLGKIKMRTKISIFPLKAHLVQKYYNKNIVLVADTAHTIHPLAGQGLNQGIKDIDCLIELITKKSITPEVLETYHQKRKQDNENMLLITDSINQIFSSKSSLQHLSRQFAFKFIEKTSFLKKTLIKYAIGQR